MNTLFSIFDLSVGLSKRGLAAWHKFRIRRRWLFLLALAVAAISIPFGLGELFKACLALGLETCIHEAIVFGNAVGEAGAEAANEISKL